MAIEGRDLNDGQILGMTIQEQDKGKVRYKAALPSGRELVSEWMNPDDMKGKTVISWCEHVRGQVDFDNREAEAAKKREKIDASDEVRQEIKAEAALEGGEGESPLTYVTRMRDSYLARVELLEGRQEGIEFELKEAREHMQEWNKVLHTLRGEVDE